MASLNKIACAAVFLSIAVTFTAFSGEMNLYDYEVKDSEFQKALIDKYSLLTLDEKCTVYLNSFQTALPIDTHRVQIWANQIVNHHEREAIPYFERMLKDFSLDSLRGVPYSGAGRVLECLLRALEDYLMETEKWVYTFTFQGKIDDYILKHRRIDGVVKYSHIYLFLAGHSEILFRNGIIGNPATLREYYERKLRIRIDTVDFSSFPMEVELDQAYNDNSIELDFMRVEYEFRSLPVEGKYASLMNTYCKPQSYLWMRRARSWANKIVSMHGREALPCIRETLKALDLESPQIEGTLGCLDFLLATCMEYVLLEESEQKEYVQLIQQMIEVRLLKYRKMDEIIYSCCSLLELLGYDHGYQAARARLCNNGYLEWESFIKNYYEDLLDVPISMEEITTRTGRSRGDFIR